MRSHRMPVMSCPVLSLVAFACLLVLQLFASCKAAVTSFSDNGQSNHTWKTSFDPAALEMKMHTSESVVLHLQSIGHESAADKRSVQLRSKRDHVASVLNGSIAIQPDASTLVASGNFTVVGNFLGHTDLYVEVTYANGTAERIDADSLSVTVIREQRVIDTVFTVSVATLVSILYINFGAALDLPTLKQIAMRPIGPIIGFLCQFVFMPLLSYGLGHLLFPDSYEMQLGLFFTGVSPAGGASNIWTVLLGGNLNLSIAMTTISTIAAFGMMPLWIFTLGRTIFDRGNLSVPYRNIAAFAVGLVVPVGIGLLIQRYSPRTARCLVRILKPMAALLILFIIIFAIVTNLYLFELFSWQIIVAGLGLPWIGYLFGFISSQLARLPLADALAISVETGVQNTGIAIFLLRFTLPNPAADLTTVVPVSAAIMTPVPLMLLYLGLRIRESVIRRNQARLISKESSDLTTATTDDTG